MLKAYAQFVTRHAVAVVLIATALTALAVTRIVDVRALKPRLLLDPSIESLLPTADENRSFYDKTRKIFGNDDTLLLALHRPGGVFEASFLGALLRITQRVGALEGVQRVVSLANAPNLASVGGDLEIAPLFEEPPTDPAELERVRRAAESSPVFRGSLLGEDGTTTGIAIQPVDMPELQFNQLGIDEQIQRIAREELADSPDVQIWLVGSAHLKAETSRFLLRDLSRVIPLAFALIMLIALLSFRSLRGLLIPLSTIGIAVIWTFAVMAEVNPALNLVTISIPPLLLVIGFVESVHIVCFYYEAIEEGAGHPTSESAASRGLEAVVLPMFLTGSTTVAGFLSLVSSPLGAIREFGLYGGIGITFTMLASLTYAPAVLQLLREPAPTGRRQRLTAFDRMLGRLASFDYHHAGKIFIGAAVLAVIALLGIPRIQINSTMISNFDEDTEIRTSVEAVNARLGASGQLQVVLETDYADAFKEPENLALIEELQGWLAGLPDVSGSTSLVDYLKQIHRGFRDDDPAFYRIPESKRLVSQLLFFGSSDDVTGFVNSQYQIANIRVRTTALDSADLGALVRRIEARLAELPGHVHGRVTGNLVLLAKTNDEIAYGQAVSVALGLPEHLRDHGAAVHVLPDRLHLDDSERASGAVLLRDPGLERHHAQRHHRSGGEHRARNRGGRHHPLPRALQPGGQAHGQREGRGAPGPDARRAPGQLCHHGALPGIPGALLLEPAPAGRVRRAGGDHAVSRLVLRPDLHARDRLADPDRHPLGGAHPGPGRESRSSRSRSSRACRRPRRGSWR